MQRKQSLWLFLSALSLLFSFFLPFGIHAAADLAGVVTDSPLTAGNSIHLLLLVVASMALSLFIIFLHRNRSLQMRLTLLLTLLTILSALDMIYLCNSVTGHKLAVGLVGSTLYLGILFPILSTVLAIMAFIGIRKDDQLLKSVDRLR